VFSFNLARHTTFTLISFLFSWLHNICIVLHCTALHCTALYCSALPCTALHFTVLLLIRIVMCCYWRYSVSRAVQPELAFLRYWEEVEGLLKVTHTHIHTHKYPCCHLIRLDWIVSNSITFDSISLYSALSYTIRSYYISIVPWAYPYYIND
jgi:hypothetical protein